MLLWIQMNPDMELQQSSCVTQDSHVFKVYPCCDLSPLQLKSDVLHSDQQVVQLSEEAKVAPSVSWRFRLTHEGGGVVSKWTQHFPHSVFSTSSPSPPVSVHLPAWISTSAKKFKKVVGKETYSETLESTPSLEKEKFPQDYFPEVGRVMTDITNVSWWMNTRLVYTQHGCSITHFKKL